MLPFAPSCKSGPPPQAAGAMRPSQGRAPRQANIATCGLPGSCVALSARQRETEQAQPLRPNHQNTPCVNFSFKAPKRQAGPAVSANTYLGLARNLGQLGKPGVRTAGSKATWHINTIFQLPAKQRLQDGKEGTVHCKSKGDAVPQN